MDPIDWAWAASRALIKVISQRHTNLHVNILLQLSCPFRAAAQDIAAAQDGTARLSNWIINISI